MADENSALKTFKCEDRLRLKTAHAEAFTSLARELIENLSWGAISDQNYTAYGWAVSFSAGRVFNVALGAGFLDGSLAKTTTAQALPELDSNTDPVQARIDLIEIATVADTASDADNEVILGAITRSTVSGEAIGTGDTTTTAWDLDHSGVDGRTLLVYLGGTQVGGWNLSPGTGAAGVDQIIFGDAPAAVAITADYTYQSGGVEGVQSVNTRYTRTPAFTIVKGTPGAGAPSWTAGSIRIAQIQVVGGWTGGGVAGVDYTITNSVKQFLIQADQDNDPDGYSPAISPYAGKLIYPVRGIDQVCEGCRVRWGAADTLYVTPGWGVLQGVSFRIASEMTVTVTNPPVTGAGWFFVYLEIGETDTYAPGSEPVSVTISPTAPNDMRRKYGDGRLVYLTSIYATAAATIRPFYTEGDWVYWEDPDQITLEDTAGAAVDKAVTEWVPVTGRLFDALLEMGYQEKAIGTAGVWFTVLLSSHLSATSRDYPSFGHSIHVPVVNIAYDQQATGRLRAEVDGATRKIHYIRDKHVSADPDSSSANLRVLGYLDDYRTMDASGSANFY